MSADSTLRPEGLVALARGQFPNLSEAEERLLHAASKGMPARCGPNFDGKDPANDPTKADNQPKDGGWGGERQIRADLIRWLCTDPEATKKVHAHGVVVHGARITGKMDLSIATVPFPVSLSSCRLTDDCNLQYVKIPALYFGGCLTRSVSAVRADVKEDVFLVEGFSAQEEVNLVGARIGGGLLCDGGHFKALNANGAEIKGSVHLRTGFSADGEVSLAGAQIGGDLDCTDGHFDKLDLSRATVQQTFVWRDVQGITELDLRDATARVMWEDESSWPTNGKLHLGGFVYGRIALGPTDAATRLTWLNRQPEFTPQPYRQLAKVLRELGDDEGAKKVLLELENRSRADGRRRLIAPARWLRFTEDTLSDATVGYGIYPGRAVWYACGLTALGWILHRRARRVGAIAPTDKDAYKEFHNNGGKAPDYYPPFSPLIYSLENCLPLVKFGQDDRWQPDARPQQFAPEAADRRTVLGQIAAVGNWLLDTLVPNWATSPSVLRWFRWITIGLGWLLATFFVAALTGIIRTGQ